LEGADEMREVVYPARKMEKMAPRVPPHASGISLGLKQEPGRAR